MSRCGLCGQPTAGPGEICVYHMSFPADDWAEGNRIMCDFVHRGIVPPAPRERANELEFLAETLDEAISP